MMNNLFSMFDPSSSFLSLNWLAILLSTMMMKNYKFKIKKLSKYFFSSIQHHLSKETFLATHPNKKEGLMSFVLVLFSLILFLNFCALFPFVFTPTAHILITLLFSMGVWMSLMFFGWLKNFSNMLIHSLPQGTPYPLMMFMVLIEMVSNMIRPITLSVRLAANMIAGHLLMCLLGSMMSSGALKLITMIFLMVALSFLEICVSIIQAYVFSTLSSLYFNEVH